MTKLCCVLFKNENKIKTWLKKLMHNISVHSNDSLCRKSDVLGWTKSLVWVFLKFKDRVLRLTPQGQESFQPLLRRQWRENHRRFTRI